MEAKLILTEVMIVSGDGSKIWTNQNINLQFDQSALDKLAAFCESDAKHEPVKGAARVIPVTEEMFEHRFDAIHEFTQDWFRSSGMVEWLEEVRARVEKGEAKMTWRVVALEEVLGPANVTERELASKPQPKTKVTVWRFGSTWSIQAATQEAYDWIKDKASEFGRLYPNEGAHLSFGFEPNANFDANEVQSYFVGLGELCPQEEERPLTNPPE